MEDLEQTLNQEINNNSGENVQEETQTSQAPEQDISEGLKGQLDKLNSQSEELWKQSNNFKQGLWKNPDDIYKSVQFYEKKFQPLEMTMKNLGFTEPAQLEQAFNEYREKLPAYQENENTINLLNALLQNEVYGSKLRNVFDEIRRAQEQERYGISFDQLPPVIQERVTKGEQAFQQLEEMKHERAFNDALSTIQDQMAQIEQIVTETGLDFDKQAFLEYCRDNNVAPENMKGAFLTSNYTQMLEKAKQSASLATSTQNKQNKAKALNSSTKQTPAKSEYPQMNSIEDLERALNQLE